MSREEVQNDIQYPQKEVPRDMVEVVRCAICIWWDKCPSSSALPEYHRCKRGRMNMTAIDFCSRGERDATE